AEINACRPFLVSRIAALPKLKVMLCLGKISHDSTVRALGLKLKDHPFGHGTNYAVSAGGRDLTLLSSYHCSRYNTNTGRLTAGMFEDVFAMAREAIDN
ncbi:MAG: uracil-DNA glycosylase, partial [Hyphomonas sp.]|nr:uracil-DNA glycosylase [Hyphomonas sp.]